MQRQEQLDCEAEHCRNQQGLQGLTVNLYPNRKETAAARHKRGSARTQHRTKPSVGIEAAEDLWTDLDRALHNAPEV